jgi:8-oxo-dGTP diphosphatase
MAKVSIACIAYKRGKILIAHRNPTGQMGSRWEFPGGKVENGEDEKLSIVREMEEEFGMKVKVIEKITENTFEHEGKHFELHVYRISVPRMGLIRKYKLTEHTEYKWVNINQIPQDNFVDSDLKVYPDVKKYIENLK